MKIIVLYTCTIAWIAHAYIHCLSPHVGVDIQPSVPNIPTLEGGGGGGVGGPGRPRGGDGGTSIGGGGDGGDGGSGVGGSGGGDGQVMVCIELATGNLQRNVTVTVMTISSLTSTGILSSPTPVHTPTSKHIATTCSYYCRTGILKCKVCR